MSGSAKHTLKTLQAFCGKHYSPRIVLFNTYWAGGNRPQRYQAEKAREIYIKNSLWKKLIEHGAHTDRLEYSLGNHPFPDNTIDLYQAQRILNIVLGIKTEIQIDLQFRDEVVRQKKKVKNTKAAKIFEDSITESISERLSELKDEKQRLEKIEDTAEEVQDIKDEIHLLKWNRAKLRGSRFGILPIWESSSKTRQPPANVSIETRAEKKEEHSARVL
jgi:vacuolar-type H+-ATPase subunit I/STV1